MKKGFTLVELSIAIVIVGLLIGGLLVGQSLVESARINKILSGNSQLKIMINQFYSKIKCLPGDCPSSKIGTGLNHSSNSGYGNGLIEGTYEQQYVLLQLQAFGIYGGKESLSACAAARYVGSAASSCFLKGPQTDSIFIVRHYIGPTQSNGFAYAPVNVGGLRDNEHWIAYGRHYASATVPWEGANPYGLLTAAQVAQIDAKGDDGLPNTGFIRGFTENNNHTSCSTPASYTNTAAVYDLNKTGTVCLPYFYAFYGTDFRLD